MSARIALPKRIMPCSKFLYLATIFPKNVGERRGRGRGRGGEVKQIFPDIKKRVEKFFPDITQ
jgi:hypothetical protein